jgi:hypothetical protein
MGHGSASDPGVPGGDIGIYGRTHYSQEFDIVLGSWLDGDLGFQHHGIQLLEN